MLIALTFEAYQVRERVGLFSLANQRFMHAEKYSGRKYLQF